MDTRRRPEIVGSAMRVVDDLPRFSEIENADQWNNPAGEERFWAVVAAVIREGYEGVRAEVLGETSRGVISSFSCNLDTPEGRLAACAWQLVRWGNTPPPVEEALSILAAVYQEQSLAPPTRRSNASPSAAHYNSGGGDQ